MTTTMTQTTATKTDPAKLFMLKTPDGREFYGDTARNAGRNMRRSLRAENRSTRREARKNEQGVHECWMWVGRFYCESAGNLGVVVEGGANGFEAGFRDNKVAEIKLDAGAKIDALALNSEAEKKTIWAVHVLTGTKGEWFVASKFHKDEPRMLMPCPIDLGKALSMELIAARKRAEAAEAPISPLKIAKPLGKK